MSCYDNLNEVIWLILKALCWLAKLLESKPASRALREKPKTLWMEIFWDSREKQNTRGWKGKQILDKQIINLPHSRRTENVYFHRFYSFLSMWNRAAFLQLVRFALCISRARRASCVVCWCACGNARKTILEQNACGWEIKSRKERNVFMRKSGVSSSFNCRIVMEVFTIYSAFYREEESWITKRGDWRPVALCVL